MKDFVHSSCRWSIKITLRGALAGAASGGTVMLLNNNNSLVTEVIKELFFA